MTDHFASLQQPRRPWLDLEALKDQFHALAARHHPDTAGGSTDAFGEISRAYEVLKNPSSRVKHLLEVEYPWALQGGDGAIAPGLADRFMEVATLLRELNVFQQQQPENTTPLTQALQASERFSLKRDAEKVLATVEMEYARSLRLLQAEDEIWESRSEATAVRLVRLGDELSYLRKWSNELREALLRLQG